MAKRSAMCLPCLALGALGLAALGWWAFYKSSNSAEELRGRTVGLARGVLNGGFLFANAELDGAVLRITGVAPDSAARQAAFVATQEAVRKAQGIPGTFSRIENAIQVVARPAAEDCQARFNRTLEGKVVRFATARADLDPSSHALLDEVAAVLLACGAYAIDVSGHTDARGSREMNLALSQARAASVIQYLGSKGIDTSRLTPVGYGPDRPLDTAGTPEALARNRRIEFNVKTSSPQG